MGSAGALIWHHLTAAAKKGGCTDQNQTSDECGGGCVRVHAQTTLWRLLALSWLHHLLRPRAKVLDVGCGTGWVSWYLGWRYKSLHLNIEAMDCSHAMVCAPLPPLIHSSHPHVQEPSHLTRVTGAAFARCNALPGRCKASRHATCHCTRCTHACFSSPLPSTTSLATAGCDLRARRAGECARLWSSLPHDLQGTHTIH